jgi:hypothetical protein
MDKRQRRGALFGRVGFYALMVVGVWLMSSASTSYWDLGEAHPFFLEKLPLAHPRWWLVALYVHVPSALLSLPACLVLLVGRVRSRWPRFHRWLGRVTGVLILCAVVPSGMYLALFAQGGLITTLGFWLTGSITFVAMLKSIHCARASMRVGPHTNKTKSMKAHKRFSTHVVAQLAVAVVSRVLLAAAELAGFYAEWAYIAALWVPVLGCALVAEHLTGPGLFSTSKGTRHEKLAALSDLDAVREHGPRRAARAAFDD